MTTGNIVLTTRDGVGALMYGDCLEIGPGLSAFPLRNSSDVKYADRSLSEPRDEVWPELIGLPKGIQPDFEVEIDEFGLSEIPNERFDSVVASHVIEHLANPINFLTEIVRVLRVNGSFLIVVPNRQNTFDKERVPTTFSHVFEEYLEDIREVSDDHIIEFCKAIYSQPAIHPDKVREWYNPEKLNIEKIELHKKRTIHVHCWNFVEFSSLLASSILKGVLKVDLKAIYLSEDQTEFGFVLNLVSANMDSVDNFKKFILEWLSIIQFSDDAEYLKRMFFSALCGDIFSDNTSLGA